jgi:hypothetical protein
VTPSELLARAVQEIDELGPAPVATSARAIWIEERRGAVELLAGLADWDGALLRRAALQLASEWSNAQASQLLLDAAVAC